MDESYRRAFLPHKISQSVKLFFGETFFSLTSEVLLCVLHRSLEKGLAQWARVIVLCSILWANRTCLLCQSTSIDQCSIVSQPKILISDYQTSRGGGVSRVGQWVQMAMEYKICIEYPCITITYTSTCFLLITLLHAYSLSPVINPI